MKEIKRIIEQKTRSVEKDLDYERNWKNNILFWLQMKPLRMRLKIRNIRGSKRRMRMVNLNPEGFIQKSIVELQTLGRRRHQKVTIPCFGNYTTIYYKPKNNDGWSMLEVGKSGKERHFWERKHARAKW